MLLILHVIPPPPLILSPRGFYYTGTASDHRQTYPRWYQNYIEILISVAEAFGDFTTSISTKNYPFIKHAAEQIRLPDYRILSISVFVCQFRTLSKKGK